MDFSKLTDKELIIKEKILLGQYISGAENSWHFWKQATTEIKIREIQEKQYD